VSPVFSPSAAQRKVLDDLTKNRVDVDKARAELDRLYGKQNKLYLRGDKLSIPRVAMARAVGQDNGEAVSQAIQREKAKGK
jgi:hypothetical protein